MDLPQLLIPEAMRAWGDPGNISLREYIPPTQAYVARISQYPCTHAGIECSVILIRCRLEPVGVSSSKAEAVIASRDQALNAEPILSEIVRALDECGLEAVLVGNAAAALQGAPVTTLDFDFMFRKTPSNLRKLRALARRLSGSILTPYYPASDLYRLVVDERGLQLDFMPRLHGIRSFEGLRSRAVRVTFGKHSLWVADLRDVIRSKKALGRSKDLAVLELLEKTLDEKEKA